MNNILAMLVPYLLQMLQDPNFQKVVQAIFANLQQKVAAGVPVTAANQHAGGLLMAASALHLTGNPIADMQAFLSQHSTVPATPVAGAFQSSPVAGAFQS